MTMQMSDRRGTMSGNDTRIADVLSTSSLSGTVLNTEGVLLQTESHKNNGGGYENTFQRQARRRTNAE